MVMVIGSSTTFEYVLRSAYETAFGRMARILSGATSEEDVFAAKAARRYVDFINHTPWYKYPFTNDLKGLWQETLLFGDYSVRNWQRECIEL